MFVMVVFVSCPSPFSLGLYNNLLVITHIVYDKPNMEEGDMKTRNIITTILAVIGGAVALSRFGTSTFGILSGVNVAVIIGVFGVFLGKQLDALDEKSKGYVVKDELTQMLERKASVIAFKFGNYVWLALLWYDFAAGNWIQLPRIESPPVIILGLLVNIGIYFLSYQYYRNRK